jgi:hypothetical protein
MVISMLITALMKGGWQRNISFTVIILIYQSIESDTSPYKSLRGTVILNGRYTLLAEEKLSLILSLASRLSIDGALEREWPWKVRFNSRENLEALVERLPLLVSPAIWKQGMKKSSQDNKALGFICLFTDGEGNYRFKCSRGFHTSLNESLASLETLIDELGDEADVEIKHQVNQTYRRLSDFLG